MKKLIIAAVVVLMSAQAFAGITVSLMVEFGHKDADRVCQPKGICSIGISVSKMVAGHIDDSTGSLVLTFSKGTAQQDLYAAEFANNIFYVPADYSVPQDICSKLGVDKFNIKANKYKVVETGESYTVTISPTGIVAK